MIEKTKIDKCPEGGEGEVINWYNSLQNDSINLILNKLKESYKAQLFYEIVRMKNDNIILRMLDKEVAHYIYIIDTHGNREKISQEKFEELTSTKMYRHE